LVNNIKAIKKIILNKTVMKIKNQIIKLMCLFTVAFTVFSCSSDDNNKEIAKLPTILEIAQADKANFSNLIEALKATPSLTATVSGQGSYTVFAPTNTAFEAYKSTNFPAGITSSALMTINAAIKATTATPAVPLTPALTSQRAELTRILQNHILGVATKADDLLNAGYVKTFASGPNSGTTLSMFINKSEADVLINGGTTNGGAKVTKADIDASNGIVHVVDSVILLPTLVNHVKANPSFTTLLAVVTSGSTGAYGDQAAILDVLTKATSNSVFNGSSNPNSSLTVFAPTNDAFAKATTGTGYLTGANATPANITKVLQYHVSRSIASSNPATTPAIPGNLVASSATSWGSSNVTINTLAPNIATPVQTFLISQNSLKITELPAQTGVSASNIKTVNIQASNGVIHAIDRVLQPVL
jgi:uncharacterized surface protein with fasciclin (FAS1) repeats